MVILKAKYSWYILFHGISISSLCPVLQKDADTRFLPASKSFSFLLCFKLHSNFRFISQCSVVEEVTLNHTTDGLPIVYNQLSEGVSAEYSTSHNKYKRHIEYSPVDNRT